MVLAGVRAVALISKMVCSREGSGSPSELRAQPRAPSLPLVPQDRSQLTALDL